MKVIKEYDNGETFLVEMARKELESMNDVDYEIEESCDDDECEETCVDLSTSNLDDNEPDCFLDEGFVVDYETLQGVLQMDLYNPDSVICNNSYMPKEQFQNSAIRYLFDCLLAHGLLKQE